MSKKTSGCAAAMPKDQSKRADRRPHKKRIWVVEMLHSGRERFGWNTTVGVGLNREDGRREEARWALRCPDDKTRLVKYERVACL